MKKLSILSAFAFILLLTSCLKDKEDTTILHYTHEDYAVLTKHLDLPEMPATYVSNGFTNFDTHNDRATLGRVLFYDKRLSANNTVSCASCHKQDKAFSDDVAFSEGFNGELTDRNSLALGSVMDFQTSYGGNNSIFSNSGSLFFWDDRATSLQEQSAETLANPIEMGTDLQELGDELLQEDFYRILFEKAFPDENHLSSANKILISLETFMNAIVSNDSKFDKGIKQTFNTHNNFSNFNAVENHGKSLFLENCASCHGERASQVSLALASNGLDYIYEDKGRGAITSIERDNGVFKVPMLRNVELTGPYMHDGRFETLEEVVEFYSSGIQNHANLHELLKEENGEPKQFNFTTAEKTALVAFLKTLTDISTIMEDKFADPFLQ